MEGFVPWPERVAATYRERGVWAGVPLGTAFATAARDRLGDIAVVESERSMTYGQLLEDSTALARALVARGICDGETILLQMPNVLEFVVAYVACLEVGAVPVMCLPHHRDAEVIALGSLARAKAWLFAARHRDFDFVALARRVAPQVPSLEHLIVLGEADGLTAYADLVAEGSRSSVDLGAHVPSPSAPAVLQLSGGTTGTPKLIARTHDDYLYNALAFARATSFGKADTILVAIPAAHNFALACPGIQGALLLGARVVLAPTPAADVVFPLVERERVTWIPAVPATLIQYTSSPLRSKYDLSSLAAIYVGGQRLNPEPARAAVDAFGPIVRQVFGMAEGLLCCTRHDDPLEVHLQTQGRPTSELDEIRVVDENGAEVPDGQLGELTCRGPYTIRGYFRAEQHNAKAFTPDGFYKSGDLVKRLPDGSIVVEGRVKDLINRGGEKISAEEIENLLLAHPAIAAAALVAYPDSVLGERACACVVLREGASCTLSDVVRYLRIDAKVASYKIPERLEVLDALPLTGVGKVSKKDLREWVRSRVHAANAT
jgi:2,3-dihydroxybenzoate-AMP ligase